MTNEETNIRISDNWREALVDIVAFCQRSGSGHPNPMLRPPWATKIEEMARRALGEVGPVGTPVTGNGPQVYWTRVGEFWHGEFNGRPAAIVKPAQGVASWSVYQGEGVTDGLAEDEHHARWKCEEMLTGRSAEEMMVESRRNYERGAKLYARSIAYAGMSDRAPGFSGLDELIRTAWIERAKKIKDWPEVDDDSHDFYLDVEDDDVPMAGNPGALHTIRPLFPRQGPPDVSPTLFPVDRPVMESRDPRQGLVPVREAPESSPQGR